MGFRCALVGLPNVGKSTLFNALTNASVSAQNYPFCTIDPNIGMVSVADPRLVELARLAGSTNITPTSLRFVDVAGLVRGASKGEGLGNQFLGHIRETQAIVHVLRCFEDKEVHHVSADRAAFCPLEDFETIATELALADIETLEKALTKATNVAKSGDKALRMRMDTLDVALKSLSENLTLCLEDFKEVDMAAIHDLHLFVLKPKLFAANVDDSEVAHNARWHKVREYAGQHAIPMVTVCAQIEAEMVGMSEDDRREFLVDLGWKGSALDKLVIAGYKLLDLLTFFTVGPKETRAWTLSNGMCASQAAGRIHSDFERGFIFAEVTAYADYCRCGGEKEAKRSGLTRLEGRDYLVQEGDIIHFRFNV